MPDDWGSEWDNYYEREADNFLRGDHTTRGENRDGKRQGGTPGSGCSGPMLLAVLIVCFSAHRVRKRSRRSAAA